MYHYVTRLFRSPTAAAIGVIIVVGTIADIGTGVWAFCSIPHFRGDFRARGLDQILFCHYHGQRLTIVVDDDYDDQVQCGGTVPYGLPDD